MGTTVPPGGNCVGKPCWTARANGFRYADKSRTRDGVQMLRLKAGATAKMTWIAKGANLGFATLAPLPLDQSPKVTVQLTNSDGRCWTADYSTPAATNTSDRFTDKSD